jgi:beta-lactam-binding protein with PASTA domain
MTIEEAMIALQRVGLVGNGVVRDVATPQANTLVDQLPNGGVRVSPGTTVLLLFAAQ